MSQPTFQQATEFRRNKQYKAALSIYRPFWEQDPNQFNEWDGWSYAYSLKETKQFKDALEVCRKLYPRFKTSEFISNLYAQCIYYTQINVVKQPPIATQKKAVKGMLRLSPPHREYSLSGVAIFKLCKNLMKEKPVQWLEIESWLNLMDPDLLSKETFTTRLPNGKTMEHASQQEEWYSLMIRVKAGLMQPKQLIELLDEAEKKNIKWHYQNDIWMKRKRAFAYHQLGQSEKAEHLLRQILQKKKEWFLYADLAEVILDSKEKLKIFSRAAIEKGKLHMKINLFKKISELLQNEETEKEYYKQHLLLRARIHLENGWNFPPDLEEQLDKEKIDLGNVNNATEVYNQLFSYWEKLAGVEENRQQGKIHYLHNNGKSGMITGDDQKEYFFGMRQIKGDKSKIEPGAKVEFEMIIGFDKKRNRPSNMAENIKIVAGNSPS